MPVVLPLLAFAFLMAGFHRRHNAWRESLLFASIPWGLFLAFITEILTQLRLLTRTGVALSWLGFGIACLAWMQLAKRNERAQPNNGEQTGHLHWMEWIVLGASPCFGVNRSDRVDFCAEYLGRDALPSASRHRVDQRPGRSVFPDDRPLPTGSGTVRGIRDASPGFVVRFRPNGWIGAVVRICGLHCCCFFARERTGWLTAFADCGRGAVCDHSHCGSRGFWNQRLNW